MIDIFNNLKYAIQYEQANLDLGNVYEKFARDTIGLEKIPRGSRVLDLGCGTGISTCTLFDMIEDVKVVGIDEADKLIDMALLKFGLLNNPDKIFQKIKEDHPYPKILRDNCDIKNLESYLKNSYQEYNKFGKDVIFYCKDASEISDISGEPFNYALASQFIHWPRKKDAKPNLNYEKKIIQQVRSNLKQNGLFGFNTNGADFRFEDNNMNKIHISKHPFYKAFMDSLIYQLGSDLEASREYTFDHNEIKRIMEENGFDIEKSKQTEIEYPPKRLLEICLVGGHMQIFKKSNIKSTQGEREKILEKALDYALRKSSPEAKPVIETGVHYVVRKI